MVLWHDVSPLTEMWTTKAGQWTSWSGTGSVVKGRVMGLARCLRGCLSPVQRLSVTTSYAGAVFNTDENT